MHAARPILRKNEPRTTWAAGHPVTGRRSPAGSARPPALDGRSTTSGTVSFARTGGRRAVKVQAVAGKLRPVRGADVVDLGERLGQLAERALDGNLCRAGAVPGQAGEQDRRDVAVSPDGVGC